jgi:hypothetical protein
VIPPIHLQDHINDNFGLFNDDDDDDEENNLTLFGKMIVMIRLKELKKKASRLLIEYQSFYFMLE